MYLFRNHKVCFELCDVACSLNGDQTLGKPKFLSLLCLLIMFLVESTGLLNT